MHLTKIIFFFWLSLSFSQANEIISLVQINNHSITNFDLRKEIYIREIMENKKITDSSQRNYLLQNLVNQKIKELELKNKEINIDKTIIDNQVNNILSKKKINPQNYNFVKEHIYKKIKISLEWNKLISIVFAANLNININEIEENIKSKKLDITQKDQIIKNEKVKKINLLSNAYFNEVKKKYLIKNLK